MIRVRTIAVALATALAVGLPAISSTAFAERFSDRLDGIEARVVELQGGIDPKVDRKPARIYAAVLRKLAKDTTSLRAEIVTTKKVVGPLSKLADAGLDQLLQAAVDGVREDVLAAVDAAEAKVNAAVAKVRERTVRKQIDAARGLLGRESDEALLKKRIRFLLAAEARARKADRLATKLAPSGGNPIPKNRWESIGDAIAFVKASNLSSDDLFGFSVAVSDDGSTLAVGAHHESTETTGVDGDQSAPNTAFRSGAVYVFTRVANSDDEYALGWTQQAYLKASNAEDQTYFGTSVALSADGNTLAVGADREASGTSGPGLPVIPPGSIVNGLHRSGAAYVFVREGSTWSQQEFLKASNSGIGAFFGSSLALSNDGNTLAVGARFESSDTIGIGGAQDRVGTAEYAGAVYVFTRTDSTWTQQEFIKASNTLEGYEFGTAVALSGDGNTLAVGQPKDSGNSTGIGGNQNIEVGTAIYAGAVLVFSRSGTVWTQQEYIKASVTSSFDFLGRNVALSDDGNTLAAGAEEEDSSATGVGGDQTNDGAVDSGAVYVFTRSGTTWTERAFVKASNTGAGDRFGSSVALSADGMILVAGAPGEASTALGVNGNQADNHTSDAGAVYAFTGQGATWQQRAYVKPSNTGESDLHFGHCVALSASGAVLAVGAFTEDSHAYFPTSFGDEYDYGAVYLY